MIRPATVNDALLVQQAYQTMLEDLQSFQCEQAATKENALAFWETTCKPAVETDRHAILLAELEGEVVGAIFWVPLDSALATNHPVAIGYGTWVSSTRRRKGLSAQLRDAAVKRLKALGVAEVIGYALAANKAGIDSALKAGFEVSGFSLRMKL